MTVEKEKVKDSELKSEVSQDIPKGSDEEPKIGVYVCHCGHNIAGTVDVAKVAEYAGTLPDVAEAKHYMFMCSKPGVQLIKDDIKEKGINRTVVHHVQKTNMAKHLREQLKRWD
jgi:heterodisulfide reductase subunit A-like polyferredoxin